METIQPTIPTALVQHFLLLAEMISQNYGNAGCNDFFVEDTPENRELIEMSEAWGLNMGLAEYRASDEYEPCQVYDGKLCWMDLQAFGFFVSFFKGEPELKEIEKQLHRAAEDAGEDLDELAAHAGANLPDQLMPPMPSHIQPGTPGAMGWANFEIAVKYCRMPLASSRPPSRYIEEEILRLRHEIVDLKAELKRRNARSEEIAEKYCGWCKFNRRQPETMIQNYILRLRDFVESFLNPERRGQAVPAHIRDDARELLGRQRVES